jgi:hypothetical protein
LALLKFNRRRIGTYNVGRTGWRVLNFDRAPMYRSPEAHERSARHDFASNYPILHSSHDWTCLL